MVLLLTITILIPVQGSSLDSIYDEQQKTEQKIQETEKVLKQKEAERKRAVDELNQLNSSMNKTNNEIYYKYSIFFSIFQLAKVMDYQPFS